MDKFRKKISLREKGMKGDTKTETNKGTRLFKGQLLHCLISFNFNQFLLSPRFTHSSRTLHTLKYEYINHLIITYVLYTVNAYSFWSVRCQHSYRIRKTKVTDTSKIIKLAVRGIIIYSINLKITYHS